MNRVKHVWFSCIMFLIVFGAFSTIGAESEFKDTPYFTGMPTYKITDSIIVLAGMKAAAPIVAPIVFSIFLAVIFGMLLYWLEKKGFSRRLALIATLAIFFSIIAVFIVVIAGAVFRIVSEIPGYQAELERRLEMLATDLGLVGFDPAWISLPQIIRFLESSTSGLAGGLLDIVIVSLEILLTTVFLILEARGFSAKIRDIIAKYRPGDLDRFTLLARRNVDYDHHQDRGEPGHGYRHSHPAFVDRG